MIDKLYKIAEGLNNRFRDGDDPFYIVTRLAEECGDVNCSFQFSVFSGLLRGRQLLATKNWCSSGYESPVKAASRRRPLAPREAPDRWR